MEWQGWGRRLIEVLELEKAPVAVTYAEEVPQGGDRAGAGPRAQRCRVCGALRLAAGGAVIDMTADNCACPGGARFLGLRAQPPEQWPALREFLIHGEKLFASPAVIHRMSATVQPPLGLAEHVIFSPLDRAELAPELVVFTCNAWQGARLINLACYETGMPMECDPTGALCRSAITYPLVTGKVNVTFGDVTARRTENFAEDELFVSLPWTHLRSVVASLDSCGAGTAPVEIPDATLRSSFAT